MKPIIWLGDTHRSVKDYPANAKREIGYNLDKIQRGETPADWKPMVGFEGGVKEIRIHLENEYRVIYIAKYPEAIYVLHAFIKKTEKTSQRELKIIQSRFSLLNTRRQLK